MLKTLARPLIDGVERNRAAPATFRIPSAAERNHVEPGAWVKIGVEAEGGPNGERFWAKVVETLDPLDGQVRYKVRVDNDLVYTAHHGIAFNDLLGIEARHILDIDRS